MTQSANTGVFNMQFTLDTNKAKQADSSGGRIDQAGKYVGKITYAEFGSYSTGSQYIEFGFEDENKLTANFRLITVKKDGEQNEYAIKKINALMACIKVKQTTVQQGTRKKYDYDLKEEVDKQVAFAPEFEGKSVGILVDMETYTNGSGEEKERPSLFASFEASTEFTAKEILDRATKPEQLAQLVARLGSRKPKPQTQGGSYGGVPQVLPQDDDTDLQF